MPLRFTDGTGCGLVGMGAHLPRVGHTRPARTACDFQGLPTGTAPLRGFGIPAPTEVRLTVFLFGNGFINSGWLHFSSEAVAHVLKSMSCSQGRPSKTAPPAALALRGWGGAAMQLVLFPCCAILFQGCRATLCISLNDALESISFPKEP